MTVTSFQQLFLEIKRSTWFVFFQLDNNQYVYYELMICNQDESCFIPISLIYGESSTVVHKENFLIKSWFDRIRFDHEHLFQSSLPSLSANYSFPRPTIVLVDDHRENPLSNATLKFFNNESFREVRRKENSIPRTFFFAFSSFREFIVRSVRPSIFERRTKTMVEFFFTSIQHRFWRNFLFSSRNSFPTNFNNWRIARAFCWFKRRPGPNSKRIGR